MLGIVEVQLELVNGGDNGRGREKLFEDLFGAVGHADSANLALLDHLLHLFPRLGDRPVGQHVPGAIWACGEVGVVALGVQVHWPVDEVHCRDDE